MTMHLCGEFLQDKYSRKRILSLCKITLIFNLCDIEVADLHVEYLLYPVLDFFVCCISKGMGCFGFWLIGYLNILC